MEKNDLTTKITRLSLSRKVTVLVLFLTILAIGLISTNRLPLEMEPKGSEGHGIYVRTAWRSGVPMESKEIMIEIDKERAESLGLDMDTLARHLRGDNFTLSSGTVIDGGKKYVLKSSSSFKTFEEINTLPINDNVSLKDIAEIKYEPEMDKRFFRFNGLESYGIQVNKESEANTVEVSRRVSEQIELIKTNPAINYKFNRII